MPVEGRAEFEAALLEIVGRVQVGAVRAARDAAHLIEARAKQKAPVKTGTLRRSIVSWPSKMTPEDFGYSVAPTIIYGRRIELGFHGADSLGRVYHQNGKPYLKPAVHESLVDIEVLIVRRIASALRGRL